MRPIESMTLVALGLMVAISNADTVYVCWDGSGDYLTIQAGIDAASDGDEVVVCDGTYTGAGNKNLDFGGRPITVRSPNGPANCIIDCEGNGRGFYFHSAETSASIVDGFTITNGSVSRGGAVFCDNSSPTISNCTLADNTAEDGGAVCCYYLASPTLTNCTIAGNTTNGGNGGGVLCDDSSPTLSNCTITGNTAGYCGGGILCDDSSPTLINCTITDNTTGDYGSGGGISCNYTTLTLANCTIADNTGYSGTGGVAWRMSSATLTNCTISANTAYYGAGGVCCQISSATLTNCTIAANTTTGRGGGMVCDESQAAVTNCVFWANAAVQGSQIALERGFNDPCELTISYSDVQGGEADVYVESGCTLNWGEGNIDADPLFVDPDGPDDDPNTWEDNDYHLSAGSPCIDAADNEAVPADELDLDEDGDTDEPIPFDLDGNPRFVDDPCTEPDTGNGTPPIVDMGAYEYQPCAGDVDCDGDTDHADLGALLGAWDSQPGDPHWNPDADLDGDGHVSHGDLGVFLPDWGCGT